ncbi:hypothetical protein BJX99DRAFT_232608 [Aspergillus californicus]
MPPTRERLLQGTAEFLDNINQWTVDSLCAGRTPSSITRILPQSLGIPDADNAAFRKFVLGLNGEVWNFRMRLAPGASPIVDAKARKVVMHMMSHGESITGPYENEYIFVITFDEKGELLTEVVEFTDSAYFQAFLARQAAHWAQSEMSKNGKEDNLGQG